MLKKSISFARVRADSGAVFIPSFFLSLHSRIYVPIYLKGFPISPGIDLTASPAFVTSSFVVLTASLVFATLSLAAVTVPPAFVALSLAVFTALSLAFEASPLTAFTELSLALVASSLTSFIELSLNVFKVSPEKESTAPAFDHESTKKTKNRKKTRAFL